MMYEFMRGIARLVVNPTHRVIYEGIENIPKDGAVIMVANHQHAYDPVVLALATKRPVHFLAKDELFRNKLFSWFFKKINCIPIDRDGMDRKAIKDSIQVLKDGEILGVFPEGTRSKDGTLLPFKSGVCFIASQAPCHILPMGMDYKKGLFHYFGEKVVVRIGKSFPYESLEGEKRKETQQRMLELQEKAVLSLISSNSPKNV